MNRFSFLLFSVLLLSNVVFAQESTISYTVSKGETVTQIAQKHKVSAAEIYRLNPESQNGIKENQILKVPALVPVPANSIIHIVGPKETLYGLATKYKVKVEVIQNANVAALAAGLRPGQELVIPQDIANQKTVSAQLSSDATATKKTHQVAPKESLFSIARLYNVSVQDLDSANAEILKDGLQVGQNIVIPNKKKTLDGRARIINGETVFYVVQPKETKYSIAKKFGITIDQLESQNPEIVNGLTEGNKLAINVKQVTPSNENEELMIALAEKQVVMEKTKAKSAEVENLKDKLAVQKELNQKVIKVNGLSVSLQEIDDSKIGSVERLKLVLEANKNIQDILISKLDSLVYTMNLDLAELKSTEIVNLETSKQLEKQSYASIAKTNEMSFQLKKDLAENRKVYSGLMDKAERLATEENLEYKKKVRANQKLHFTADEIKKMQQDQLERDGLNDALLSKIDSLGTEKKVELKRHISKATFYGAEARNFDDKLALLKLNRYKTKVQDSHKGDAIAQTEKALTFEEKKEIVKKDPQSVAIVEKMEVLDNLKQVGKGYYIVLGAFEEADARDEFVMKLIDSGNLNASFFYNVNILSYYVYSETFATEEEALYEYKLKANRPLFGKSAIVRVENY